MSNLMRSVVLVLLILCSVFIFISNVPAQGCSDAGFCTVSTLKPNLTDSTTNNNQIKIGISAGKADHTISAVANFIEYNRTLNNRFGLSLKLTTLSQSGNDIAAFGYSDIFLNANFKMNDKLMITAGVKTPLTDGNRMKDSLPLPMDYQSSLGTFDIIAGVGYRINKLQFVVAYQQPLTQNKNQFLMELYPESSPLSEFQSTNKFVRNGDVLLRVAYPFALSKAITFTPGILPIYHLNNDKFTDKSGLEREINGSKGLTLNGNLFFDLRIDGNSALQLSLGAPFIVRDSRPDGLTRSFIANLEYMFMF